MQLHSRFFTSFIYNAPPTPSHTLSSHGFSSIFRSVRCICSSNGSTAIGDVAATHPGVAKVVLKKGKTQFFRDGNPMVYSGAVDRVVGRPAPKTGDIVLVADGSEKPIAWGIYNSVSMFCVRLMQMEEEANRDPSCILNMEELIHARINAALELRRRLNLPRPDTNAYRLVNSEGDRLSGLIVDVFGNHAVIASSAAWVEKYRSVIEIHVKEICEIDDVKWRPSVDMLKEEGLNIDLESEEPLSTNKRVKVMENGINYIVSLEGQKTGFYADQRDNRHLVGSLSKGCKVLDVFCYTGGFALNASIGGAVHVTGIDSSLPALELAEENAKLNNFDLSRISFLKEDATGFMKAAISNGISWDLVILDPPKLAPSRKVLQRATTMYRNINGLAMRLTKRGGFLMTCSCSGAMTQSGLFLSVLQVEKLQCLGKLERLLITLLTHHIQKAHILPIFYFGYFKWKSFADLTEILNEAANFALLSTMGPVNLYLLMANSIGYGLGTCYLCPSIKFLSKIESHSSVLSLEVKNILVHDQKKKHLL